MKNRVSKIRPMGTAYLPNHELVFNKHSKDQSDKAAKGVWGALYEMTADEFEVLKKSEQGYEVRGVKTVCDNLQSNAVTFVSAAECNQSHGLPDARFGWRGSDSGVP